MCVFCPLFDGEGSSECPALGATLAEASGVVLEYPQGARLYEEGDVVTGVYCIQSGRIGLFRNSRTGDPALIAFASPGDLLGVMELLERRSHSGTAQAIQDTRVCFIPDQQFRDLVAKRPVIVFNVMRRVCQQLNELDRKIESAA